MSLPNADLIIEMAENANGAGGGSIANAIDVCERSPKSSTIEFVIGNSHTPSTGNRLSVVGDSFSSLYAGDDVTVVSNFDRHSNTSLK